MSSRSRVQAPYGTSNRSGYIRLSIFSNSLIFFSGKINFKLINSFFLSITKFGFIPTLFVIIVFAIKSPFLSTMLDLNSDITKFLFDILFFKAPRKTALVEKINEMITKTKK